MIYLIQYHREPGRLLSFEAFPASDRQGAEEARLRMETRNLMLKKSYEVVLIEAKNEGELRKTHRRYFETLEQLINHSPAIVR